MPLATRRALGRAPCLGALAFALAACVGEAVTTRAPASPPPAERPAKRELSCDDLVPAPIRQKYVPGTQMAETSLAARTVMCSANRGGRSLVHVRYDCRTTSTLAQWEARAEEVKRAHPAYRDIPGVGRAAIGTDTQIELYDDDADCVIEVVRYDGQAVLELARELTVALEPRLVPLPEKGRFALRCEKLLPLDLRDRFLPGSRLEATALATDSMECKLRYPDATADVVTYDCGRPHARDLIRKMKAQYDSNRTPADDVSVGAGGLYLSMMGSQTVAFVDADLGCLVNVQRTRGDKQKTIELARAVDDALSAVTAN